MVLNELLGQTKVIYEVTQDYIITSLHSLLFLFCCQALCYLLLSFWVPLCINIMIVTDVNTQVSEPMPQVIRTQPALYTARFLHILDLF